jgi:hypothetical protein
MVENLSKREAYAAMFAFLEEIYQRTESADLGALLGGMSLLKDGGTADPAAWADWEAAVRKVKERKVNLDLDLHNDD